MQYVVIKMSKESTFGFEVLYDRQGLFQTKMRRMRLDADAVENENVEVTKPIH